MNEPRVGDVVHVCVRQVRLDQPWSEVRNLLGQVPGLLVLVTDQEGDPIGLLDERAAKGTSEVGSIEHHLESLLSTIMVEADVPVSNVLSAMMADQEFRWCVVKNKSELFTVAAPEAILSAHLKWRQGRAFLSRGQPVIASIYGIPFTDPDQPMSYRCQGTPTHVYDSPPPRDKFKRARCPIDDTQLVGT